MKKYQSLSIVILVFVLQTLLHYFIGSYYGLANEQFFKIYGFLFFITLVVLLIVEFSNAYFKEQLGFVFLAIIVFKLIAAILFMKMTDMSQSPQKYHFLLAYLFLILVYTIYVAQKLLNTDKKH